jgi:hypothetical protein
MSEKPIFSETEWSALQRVAKSETLTKAQKHSMILDLFFNAESMNKETICQKCVYELPELEMEDLPEHCLALWNDPNSDYTDTYCPKFKAK